MRDSFGGHHLSHIGFARRVAYHARAAAYKRDRLISRLLEPFHKAERHEMTYMEAVGGRVEADIERGFSRVYHFADFFFVRYLSDKPAADKFFIKFHFSFPFVCLMAFYLNVQRT